MRHARQVERLLADMTPGDKAELLQIVVRDLGEAFPGIDVSPNVCGGQARVVRTRIPVWVLVQARRLGASEEEILRAYPQLKTEDLAHAWAYALSHSADIEQQIRQNEAA